MTAKVGDRVFTEISIFRESLAICQIAIFIKFSATTKILNIKYYKDKDIIKYKVINNIKYNSSSLLPLQQNTL